MTITKQLATKIMEFDPLAEITYYPWNINDTKVMFADPLTHIRDIEYVICKHNNPQTKMFSSLAGGGVFVSNRNQSGTIEIGVANFSISVGRIELSGLTGIPFPITIQDIVSAGTSSVIGTACKQTDTPEWKRAAAPEIKIYTFETPRLLIAQGIHLPFITF
jgi:hypothetical protein